MQEHKLQRAVNAGTAPQSPSVIPCFLDATLQKLSAAMLTRKGWMKVFKACVVRELCMRGLPSELQQLGHEPPGERTYCLCLRSDQMERPEVTASVLQSKPI